MTEKESNCECNSINFGEFTREDIDKIMTDEGYEKDPNENEWIYKPKDRKLKKLLFLPKNKGRLEKEKDEDIINNIRNKGLNPYARDFVPRNKEKSTPFVNQPQTTQVQFVPMYYGHYYYPYYPQTPDMYYPVRMTPRNYTYGTYPSQEGMMPGNANRMEYDIENAQANGRVPMPMYAISVPPATMMHSMPGRKMNDFNKNMMPMNEKYENEGQNNNIENNENQDVIIDIGSSNEDISEIQENDINEVIEDDEKMTETIQKEIENQPEEKIDIEEKENENEKEIEKEDKVIEEQKKQPKKKKNSKEKNVTEESSKTSESIKNKSLDDTKKSKPNEQPKKTKESKETKEVNKSSYASKVMESGNKKKGNDKKKNSISKVSSSKDSKLNEIKDNEKVNEEVINNENEVKEDEKEDKAEEDITTVTEEEKKEEQKEEKKEDVKKEEVKKEEVKKEDTKQTTKSWASLFKSEDTKSNVAKTKTNKVKASTTKTVPKSQTNISEPVNLNDKIKISFEQVPIQPRGLVNNGNMCFMNAILQPLLYCPPFYNFIYSLKKETVHGNKLSIIESMITFFDEFKVVKKKDLDVEDYGESFFPEYVYSALRKYNSSNFLQGRQEDAEEYLGFLLNGIHEEFISKYTKTTNSNKKSDGDGWMEVGPKNKLVVTREAEVKESPINKIFGGRIKSILKCPGTKNSATIEPFLSLQLDITPESVHDIEDALENLTVPEIVPDYSVNGNKVSATKQNVIDGLPNILLLHLKCFTFDHNTTQKVQKQLTLSQY